MNLRDYQIRAVDKIGNKSKLLLAPTGSGKTIIANEIIKRSGLTPIIICNASIVEQWKKYHPHVWSFEKIIRKSHMMDMSEIVDRDACILIIDESQRLKSAYTKTSKFFMKIRKHFKQILCMTACQAPNNLLEYYTSGTLSGDVFGDNPYLFNSQYSVLRRGREVIPNTAQARKLYLARGFKVEIPDASRESILTKLQDFVVTISDAEVSSEIPDSVYNKIYYEIDVEAYTRACSEYVVCLEDETVPITNKLALLSKLRQIEGGFFYDGDSRHLLRRNKFDALVDFANNSTDKLIIFTQFTFEADLIRQAICSSTGSPQDFLSGKYKCLVGHPSSIGVGLDGFQDITNIACFFSSSYSWESRMQAEGRVRRFGQKRTCVYYDVVPSNYNSITFNILDCLKDKKSADQLVKEFLKGMNNE